METWAYVLGIVIVVVILNVNYALAWVHWELEHGKWQNDKKFLLLRKVLWPYTYLFEINKLDDDDRPVMEWKRSAYLTLMTVGGFQLKVCWYLISLAAIVISYLIAYAALLLAYGLQVVIWPTRLMGLNSFTPGTDLRRSLGS